MSAPVSTDTPRALAGVAYRGRLFRKYLLLILTLVSGALLASGGISIYFSYQENKSALASLQQEKAIAAASRIEQYIRQIEQQLKYAALPQLDAGDVELRRIEFLKLLRQAPEVTDIVQLDAAGREMIAVSRLGMDVVASGKDRSQEPAFRGAKRGQAWFGPVYFRKETEPYMTIALRSGGDNGSVTVAEVNLKFIWDVVTRIKIGDKGKAYVIDNNGFLVADPDIGLVLRKTNLSTLSHVAAATGGAKSDEPALVSADLGGVKVLASVAPIESLDWKVFVEQPVSEVYAKLDASILRTGLLLLAGLVISALGALALARGMVRPIRTLDEGARRIGAGELDQSIDIQTGDELEGLADQFNRMSTQLRESYAGLERKVDERTVELKQALEQQTAVSEILRVISSSPTNVQPVLDAIAERAARLCNASAASIYLVDGGVLRHVGSQGSTPDQTGTIDTLPINRESLSGRALLERRTIELDDVQAEAAEYPLSFEYSRQLGHRSVLVTPLYREGTPFGTILLRRQEVRHFSEHEIALVRTFGDQAAIALENVRLFNETREALEQQRASGEVLAAISSSIADTGPVFEKILSSAELLFAGKVISINLVGDDGQVRIAAYRGPDRDKLETLFYSARDDRESGTGRAIALRSVLHYPDVANDPDVPPGMRAGAEATGVKAGIVAPMLWEGKGIGAIIVGRDVTGPFSEKDIALLRTFADQAVIAIQNARLFNETKEALEQQTAISEILRVISNSPTDVQPVLDAVAERALNLCDAAHAVIALVEGPNLRFVAGFGSAHDAVGEVVPLNRGLVAGRAILDRAPVHIDDLAQVSDDEYPDARRMQARIGHHTVLAVPLMREGQAIGAIALWRMEVRRFTDKELWLVKTFADQAGIAIDNVRLFREIQDKSRQLEVANQHKSEFLANMSHELRTPLNAIIGFSEVLLESLFGEINPKQEDYLKDIHSSGRHLLTLINDILDLSKVEAGRMDLETSTFDVSEAIANAMTLVRERAQRHAITLAQEVDPALGEIVADERKFKQILLNLLTNAVKFTPDGGRIDVRAHADTGNVIVAVHDTGIGIAPDDQAAVFEEFRQVGRNYTNKQEGTGLGLTLTRKFVELHGGRIWLESEPGKGSTFTFSIPRQR